MLRLLTHIFSLLALSGCLVKSSRPSTLSASNISTPSNEKRTASTGKRETPNNDYFSGKTPYWSWHGEFNWDQYHQRYNSGWLSYTSSDATSITKNNIKMNLSEVLSEKGSGYYERTIEFYGRQGNLIKSELIICKPSYTKEERTYSIEAIDYSNVGDEYRFKIIIDCPN